MAKISRYFGEYKNFASEPVKEMKKIYQQFGLELTAETEKKMESFMAENPIYSKYGRHKYDCLSKYGITLQDLEEIFHEYDVWINEKTGHGAV